MIAASDGLFAAAGFGPATIAGAGAEIMKVQGWPADGSLHSNDTPLALRSGRIVLRF
jgi:hypothetical protein